VKVNKAFRYRIFPTDEQKKNLAQTFGCVRLTFNTMLDARTKAWQQDKQHLSYPILRTDLRKNNCVVS
jgi:putative transposase